jgi:hypothetical protein
MSKETITAYGSGILSASPTEMTIDDALTAPSSYPGTTLGQSLISISRAYYVRFDTMTYNGNWQIETDYTSTRAQLIYLDQFYGYIEFG